MQTTTQTIDYTGLTIELTDDIASMERWLTDDPDDLNNIDFDATVDAYAAAISAELQQAFPGVRVTYRLDNGNSGARVTGNAPDDIWIEQDELADAIVAANEAVVPHGDVQSIIVDAS